MSYFITLQCLRKQLLRYWNWNPFSTTYI